MTIELGKTYRTRDGRDVRIYAVDCGGDFPVHGAVKSDDRWQLKSWKSEGYYTALQAGSHALDLIEVKPRIKRRVWVNVYPEGCGIPDALYYGRASADGSASPRRIACVEIDIDVEEGHGL